MVFVYPKQICIYSLLPTQHLNLNVLGIFFLIQKKYADKLRHALV